MSRRAFWLLPLAALVVIYVATRSHVPAAAVPAQARTASTPATTHIPVPAEEPSRLTPSPKADDVEREEEAPRSETAPDETRAPVPGLRVEGRVQIRHEAPLPDVPVRVTVGVANLERPLLSATVRTDEHGEYVYPLDELERLSPLARPFLLVKSELEVGGLDQADAFRELGDRNGDVVRLDLWTRRITSVHGRVVSAQGEPIQGAEVRAYDVTSGPRGHPVTPGVETDAGGGFLVVLWKSESIVVRASHPEHGRGEVKVEPGGGAEIGDVELVPQGVLAGEVVGGDGTPVVGVYVTCTLGFVDWRRRPERVYTDDEGRFRFANLLDGEYTVGTGYGSTPLQTLRPSREDLRLTVERATACIRVRDEWGRIVPGFDLEVVRVRQTDDSWEHAGFAPVDATTDDEGVLHVVFPKSGTFALAAVIDVDGERWSARRRLTVEREHHEVDLLLEREPRRLLHATVLDPDGQPVEQWTVRAVDPATGLVAGTLNASEGGGMLAPGKYRALAAPGHSYCLPFEVPFEVPSTGPAELTFRAPAWGGKLVVAPVAADGKQHRIRVRVRREGGPEDTFTLFTGEERERWRALAPGPYTVEVEGEGEGETWTVEVVERATQRWAPVLELSN